MPSDPSNEHLELRPAHVPDEAEDDAGEVAAAKTAGRRARKPSRAKHTPGDSAGGSGAPSSDDSGERLREQAVEVLAATRERIVEKPLQAVLVAAAAGAFFALLLGAARR